MKSFLIALTLLIALSAAYSQNAEIITKGWTYFILFDEDTPGALVADGRYTSDYGATWIDLDIPYHRTIEIHKNYMFIATGNSAYVSISSDYGKTWNNSAKTFTIGSKNDTSVFFTQNIKYIKGNLIISDGSKFLTSKDFGKTWMQNQIKFPAGTNIRMFNIKDDYISFASNNVDSIYFSYDVGKTWSSYPVKGLMAPGWILSELKLGSALFVIAQGSKYISYDSSFAGAMLYRSLDNGETWEYLLRAGKDSIFGYPMTACDNILYLVNEWKQLLMSEDMGTTWTEIYNDAAYILGKSGNYLILHSFHSNPNFLFKAELKDCKLEPIVITSAEDGNSSIDLIYPNPAKNLLEIKLKAPAESFEIYNALGVKVKEGIIENSLGDTFIIDISQMKEGVYLLSLTAGSERNIEKFIIKR